MMCRGDQEHETLTYLVRRQHHDQVNRKLFVRGINWNTTNESLEAAFAEFGEVEEATIVTDKATGKSKVSVEAGRGFPTLVVQGSLIFMVTSGCHLSIPLHPCCPCHVG